MPAARAEHAPWRATARVRKRAESCLVSGAGGVTGCVVRAAQAQMPPEQCTPAVMTEIVRMARAPPRFFPLCAVFP